MENNDFEPPSFSLGLDLETQPDPLLQPAKRPLIEEDDDDFESPVRVLDPPRAFKRLRRGPTTPRKVESADERFNVNEEIEDFSSDEDWPRGVVLPNSVCSSSKPSLHGQGCVTTESGSQLKSSKGKQVPRASASVKVGNKASNVIFPKLTVSPLRRYQLIESDSDDPSMIEDPSKEVPLVVLSPEDKQSNCKSNLWTRRVSPVKYQSEDLWKDFCSEKSPCIPPTPAFDEVIEEYFTKSKPGTENKDTCNANWDETTLAPAHSYFFHKDFRIQKLVRDRLPYFSPLGAGNNQEYEQQNESVIDYMGQFGHEDTRHRQTNQRRNIEKSSTGNKKIVNKSHVDSVSRASSNWVNPRSYAGIQKNAGSRRVQAEGKSAGHWYTGPDGKRGFPNELEEQLNSCYNLIFVVDKVYVNEKGQELAGQIAYRHYRKESGMGFKNSKKKTSAKKKSVATKKCGPKKK